MTLAFWIACWFVGLFTVGVIGPWETSGSISASGLDTNGTELLLVPALSAGLLWAYASGRDAGLAAPLVLLGVIGVALSIAGIADVDTAVGWGALLAVPAAVGQAISSFALR